MDFAKIIEGLAALLWPVIIVILILVFRPAVRAIIKSAESRKFTLKIGGQELTMEEANEQQSNDIADIRSQLLEIKRKIEGDTGPAQALSEPSPTIQPTRVKKILWVDDNPKNNSYHVKQLADTDFVVELATSTIGGLKQFYQGQFGLIISDMGRTEQGSFIPTAGLMLLKEIRLKDPNIPIIIFTTSHNVRRYESEAKALGATLVTSSPTELFGALQILFG